MTKRQNIIDFLEKHANLLASYEEKVFKNCGSFNKPISSLPNKTTLIIETLQSLIKVIKYQMKLKDMTIEQLFTITNKVVDIQDFQHIFKDPNAPDIQIGGTTGYAFFELDSE